MPIRPSARQDRAEKRMARSVSSAHSLRTADKLASTVKFKEPQEMAKNFAIDSPPAAPMVQTRFRVLGALSFSHFLNDMMQSLILAIYPLLKGEFHLSFAQIGAITLTYQACASLL